MRVLAVLLLIGLVMGLAWVWGRLSDFHFVRRTPSKSRDCARARNAIATQQAAWRAWIVEADKVCFGALTRAAAVKAHSPAWVIPIIFSAGGALRACDNDLLPEPEDRNGRHWMRVELGTILMKFAFEISSSGQEGTVAGCPRCRRRPVFSLVYVVNTPFVFVFVLGAM